MRESTIIYVLESGVFWGRLLMKLQLHHVQMTSLVTATNLHDPGVLNPDMPKRTVVTRSEALENSSDLPFCDNSLCR